MQSNKTYYKKKYHGSVIIYYLSKFSKRVANLAKSSILLGFFCDFDNLEGKYKSSVTSGFPFSPPKEPRTETENSHVQSKQHTARPF